jgi:hypothetical protein
VGALFSRLSPVHRYARLGYLLIPIDRSSAFALTSKVQVLGGPPYEPWLSPFLRDQCSPVTSVAASSKVAACPTKSTWRFTA